MAGRSSIERLPPPLLALVHEGILEGATIDQIIGRIRAEVESGWRGRTPETRDVGALRLDSDSHPMRSSIHHEST